MQRSACSIPTLFLALSLFPLHPLAADRDTRLAEAKATFRAASDGDKSKTARAHEALQALAAESPQDPVILAYAGAAATLLGRDAWSPIKALKETDRGLDQIDLALKKLGPEHDALRPGEMPARLETLLVAASTFLQVPDKHFHRRQDGKAALAAAVSHPAYAHMPPAVHAKFEWVAALASRAEQNTGEERAALEKVLALDPSGELAPKAQARLAELSR
jgi:hypothetical protein